MSEALQTGITDLLRELIQIQLRTTDRNLVTQLNGVVRDLERVSAQALRVELDRSAAEYDAALVQLGAAERLAKEAVADIAKTAEVIAKAGEFARALDGVIGKAVDVLA